jgi:hypothetical protein
MVAERLRYWQPRHVVLDPVMVAKSGDRLLHADAVQAMREELLPLATVVTPNLPEAGDLVRHEVTESPDDMRAAARALIEMGAQYALVKGGHGTGDTLVDLLYDGASFIELPAQRIHTKNTHGTGCTLSAALAALIAVMWLLSAILLPFIAGLVLAYFLDPIADRLQTWEFSRLSAALLIVIVALVLVVTSLVVFVPMLADQVGRFAGELPRDAPHRRGRHRGPRFHLFGRGVLQDVLVDLKGRAAAHAIDVVVALQRQVLIAQRRVVPAHPAITIGRV